jgi:hypothetical protein
MYVALRPVDVQRQIWLYFANLFLFQYVCMCLVLSSFLVYFCGHRKFDCVKGTLAVAIMAVVLYNETEHHNIFFLFFCSLHINDTSFFTVKITAVLLGGGKALYFHHEKSPPPPNNSQISRRATLLLCFHSLQPFSALYTCLFSAVSG